MASPQLQTAIDAMQGIEQKPAQDAAGIAREFRGTRQ